MIGHTKQKVSQTSDHSINTRFCWFEPCPCLSKSNHHLHNLEKPRQPWIPWWKIKFRNAPTTSASPPNTECLFPRVHNGDTLHMSMLRNKAGKDWNELLSKNVSPTFESCLCRCGREVDEAMWLGSGLPHLAKDNPANSRIEPAHKSSSIRPLDDLQLCSPSRHQQTNQTNSKMLEIQPTNESHSQDHLCSKACQGSRTWRESKTVKSNTPRCRVHFNNWPFPGTQHYTEFWKRCKKHLAKTRTTQRTKVHGTDTSCFGTQAIYKHQASNVCSKITQFPKEGTVCPSPRLATWLRPQIPDLFELCPPNGRKTTSS